MLECMHAGMHAGIKTSVVQREKSNRHAAACSDIGNTKNMSCQNVQREAMKVLQSLYEGVCRERGLGAERRLCIEPSRIDKVGYKKKHD